MSSHHVLNFIHKDIPDLTFTLKLDGTAALSTEEISQKIQLMMENVEKFKDDYLVHPGEDHIYRPIYSEIKTPSQLLGKRWNTLSEEEKQPYLDDYYKELAKPIEEKQVYNGTPENLFEINGVPCMMFRNPKTKLWKVFIKDDGLYSTYDHSHLTQIRYWDKTFLMIGFELNRPEDFSNKNPLGKVWTYDNVKSETEKWVKENR